MAKYCHKCGKQIRSTAKFCNHCGTKLKVISQQKQQKKPVVRTKLQVKKKERREPRPQSPSVKPTIAPSDRHTQIRTKITEEKPVDQDILLNLTQQQQFDMLLKPKISRMEYQIDNFEIREKFSKFDYENFQRNIDELNEYSKQPYFKNSKYTDKFRLLEKRIFRFEIKILENLTQDYVDKELLTIRETWRRINIDEIQTNKAINHIDELRSLGDALEKGIKHLLNILGKCTHEEIYLSRLFATKPEIHLLYYDTLAELFQPYFTIIDTSNHKDIFKQEIHHLKQLNSLLNPESHKKIRFTTKFLQSLGIGFLKSRENNSDVLIVVQKSLKDHKKDIEKEKIDTQLVYISIMETLLKSGSSSQIISSPIVSVVESDYNEVHDSRQLDDYQFTSLNDLVEINAPNSRLSNIMEERKRKDLINQEDESIISQLSELEKLIRLPELTSLTSLSELRKKRGLSDLKSLN